MFNELEPKPIKKLIVIGVIAVLFLTFLFGGFRTISAGEVGIKTRFGKVVGKQLNEGLHFKLPLLEKITKINIKVQKTEITGASASKDLQDISILSAINFRVDYTKAVDIFRNVGTDYIKIILEPAINESIKSVSAKFTAEELITKRQEVSVLMQEALQKKVEKYGLKLDNFNIISFNFSPIFNQAIEEKQVAEQKVATAKNKFEEAKIEAERKVMEAEATSKANALLEQSLSDKILEQRAIEKWNGELPQFVGGNSIPFINLNSEGVK